MIPIVVTSNNESIPSARRARPNQPGFLVSLLAPLGVAVAALVLWQAMCSLGVVPETMFPTPAAVGRAFGEEFSTGRIFRDTVASLLRVGAGFGMAVLAGIPLGLWLGHKPLARAALLPGVNFLRCLSPLAWIPFAVFWFGIGHAPAIFLIFMASFFPLVVATMAAVASIPVVYFRVAHDFDIRGIELLRRVTLAAIAPEIVTSLRVTAGLSWVVVVAAEMLAGREGLGYAVMDARNGLRADLLVVEMIAIGTIGVALDRALMLFTLLPSVRWGYER